MKKSILILTIVGLFTSCSDDDTTNNELLGSWKLIETLIDSGDGHGTFQPVVSDKIITFSSDEIVTSNGSLCEVLSIQSPDSGTYSIVDSTINSSGCTLNFELMKTTLIIEYPFCREHCLAKYIKI